MNQHNQHTIGWGVLKEDLDNLEDKMNERRAPVMHT